MTQGIYITPTKFVSFAELKVDRGSLTREIASRSLAWDFAPLMGLLPDPDPVLRKRGDGVEILEELTADGHLLSVMQSRKLGTLKRELEWQPGVDEVGKTSSQAEALCSDLKRDLAANVRMRDLMSSILDAPYYGMTPIELTFEPLEGRLALKKLQARPVRWFGYDENNEPRFRSQATPDEGELLPWGKFVFVRHFPTYDNPYGLRLLTRCFWPITFKKGGIRFWVTFMEKYGMPFLLGRYSRGTSADEQQAMLTKLQNMVRDAVAVVPEGDTVELLNQAGGGGGSSELFEKMKSVMDDEVSKVIVGQTLTTQPGESGSYALGKVHDDVLTDFQESDQTLAKSALDEIGAVYARVNAENVPAPTVKFFEAEDPQKDFADRDKVLEESGRLRFTRSYYLRRYKLQEDDFELVDAAPAQEAPIGDPDTPPAEHAEPGDGERIGEQAQDRLDHLADDHVQDGLAALIEFKGVLRDWLATMETVDDASAAIVELFDRLDTGKLQKSLTVALIESERIGAASVPDTADHAETLYGFGRPFKEAVDYFEAKGLTISGQTREDLVAAVKDELAKSMREGGDIKTFRNNVDALFVRHGLDPMEPYRLDTIYRTNMQSAFQAGRYMQLTKQHILQARPYWKYVAVRDGATRPAHRQMHGKVFRHDNPIWRTWYPPNGFNCRCQVVSLSAREVERDGLTVEERDISGEPFEVVNETTGEIKTFVLNPDRNWGAAGGTLEKLLDQPAAPPLRWQERPDQPGPAELGRPMAAEIDGKQWQNLPRSQSLEELMDRGLTRADALLEIEADYRKTMGISPLESQAVLRSKDGMALTVTLQGLAQAMAQREDARERFIPHLRQVLENPYEIVLTEYATDGGETRYRRKYIGLFADGNNKTVLIVAELLPDGTVLWQVMNAPSTEVDSQRHGVKLIYGRT